MTLSDFNELASEKLGFPIKLPAPYKLCDFRPAFRIIFESFLEPYDFWGYGDLDLIYGNIRRFLTDDVLDQHDVITSAEELMAGHFSLFRNSEKTNRLFEGSPRYKRIFQDRSHHYAFDEFYRPKGLEKHVQQIQRRLMRLLRPPGKSGIDGPNYFVGPHRSPYDITQLVKQAADKGTLRLYNKSIHTSKSSYQRRRIKDWKLAWDSGTLADLGNGTELLYYHFLASRRKKAFLVPSASVGDLSRFYINKRGITLQ